MTALRVRKPTGVVPWPLILIEGQEKSGKSWACAELSASDKVGQTYWIDLGEGAADEYGAIPGARYLIVEHDGSFTAILEAVRAVADLAEKANANGEPPVVLVIDSMTAEWDLLKGAADAEARRRLAKKGRQVGPDDEPRISMDIWNTVGARHRKLMTALMTFPGIAVVTARGRDVAALDDRGQPIEGRKEYKVEGHKNLAYDATAWVRVSRDHPPLVVGVRSVHHGVRPGVDKPVPSPGLTLERVVFDVIGCQPATAQPRDLAATEGTAADLNEDVAGLLAARIAASGDRDQLTAAWRAMNAAAEAGHITADQLDALQHTWHARKAELFPPAPAPAPADAGPSEGAAA